VYVDLVGDPSDTRGQYSDARPGDPKPGDPRAGIDRMFRAADRALGAVGELLGVPAERARERARAAGMQLSRWRIEEAIDADRGTPAWIVTNGVDRAECSSPEFADRVLTLLAHGGR